MAVAESDILVGAASVLSLAAAWLAMTWISALLPDRLLFLRAMRFDPVPSCAVTALAFVTLLVVSVAVTYVPKLRWLGEEHSVRHECPVRSGRILLAAHVAITFALVLAGTKMMASAVGAATTPLGYEPTSLIHVTAHGKGRQ